MPLDHHDGLLHVRPPHTVRLMVRVTDRMAEAYRLVTNFTSALHGHVPCTSLNIARELGARGGPPRRLCAGCCDSRRYREAVASQSTHLRGDPPPVDGTPTGDDIMRCEV
jgi:hypothetical protein